MFVNKKLSWINFFLFWRKLIESRFQIWSVLFNQNRTNILINKTKLIFKLKTWKIVCYYIFLHKYLYDYQLLHIESCCRHIYCVKLFVYIGNNLSSQLRLQLNYLFDFICQPLGICLITLYEIKCVFVCLGVGVSVCDLSMTISYCKNAYIIFKIKTIQNCSLWFASIKLVI